MICLISTIFIYLFVAKIITKPPQNNAKTNINPQLLPPLIDIYKVNFSKIKKLESDRERDMEYYIKQRESDREYFVKEIKRLKKENINFIMNSNTKKYKC